MGLNIALVDLDSSLVGHWSERFAGEPQVSARLGDYFSHPADAMVSPANSFGFMDGGLDLAIREVLGQRIQQRVQGAIQVRHHGELPVGSALMVETQHPSWPHLIVAPTMRLPADVSDSLNAYLAFRAILLEIKRFNASKPEQPIRSVLCPGLGTGVGRLAPERCALQMWEAYQQCVRPATLPNLAEIWALEQRLQRVQ